MRFARKEKNYENKIVLGQPDEGPCDNNAGKTLSDLTKGQGGIVVCNQAQGLLKQKLLNMGFIPGARIQMIRNAPLRDPIEIGIQNYMVTLRRSEASLIKVEAE